MNPEALRDAWRWTPATFATRVSVGQFKVENHTRFLSNKIAATIAKGGGRLMVNAPPRHGKSHLISYWLPIWFLEMFPHKRVVVAAYGEPIAVNWGRLVRNEFASNPLLTTKLREDSKAAGRWNTPQGGGMMCVGVGGALSGFGFDLGICFSKGTLVKTECGEIEISELVAMKDRPRVWTFNHALNRCELKRIVAAKENTGYDFRTITTHRGSSLSCTAEHKIFIAKAGYRPAYDLVRGDRLLAFQEQEEQNLSPMRKGQTWARTSLFRLRSFNSATIGLSKMLSMSNHIQPQTLCARKADSPGLGRKSILFADVQLPLSEQPKNSAISCLSKMRPAVQKRMDVLFNGLSERRASEAHLLMQAVWNKLSSPQHAPIILRKEMSERGALKEDARQGKFALQNGNELQQGISRHPPGDIETGQSSMRNLCVKTTASGSSYRRVYMEQHTIESDNAMSAMPFKTPSCSEDAVALVEASRNNGETVYDITVEDNANFFANGILVHNCDDLIKNWQDAHSLTVSEHLYEWWKSTFLTRAEPNATEIVGMTRWTTTDICSQIQNDNPNEWEVIRLPAIAEENDPIGRPVGAALCPSRYNEDALKLIRGCDGSVGVGAPVWHALYQQRPDPFGAGRLFSRFSAANISDRVALRADMPLAISLDFNINPGNHAIIGQYDNKADVFTVTDEIYGPRMDIRTLVTRFGEFLKTKGWQPGLKLSFPEIHVYGDATGESEWAGTSESLYDLVRQQLKHMRLPFVVRHLTKNPPLRESIDATNEAFRDVEDRVHVLIHPRCAGLIKDLQSQQSDSNGLIDKKDDAIGHYSDTFRYWCHYMRPLYGRGVQSSGIVAGVAQS